VYILLPCEVFRYLTSPFSFTIIMADTHWTGKCRRGNPPTLLNFLYFKILVLSFLLGFLALSIHNLYVYLFGAMGGLTRPPLYPPCVRPFNVRFQNLITALSRFWGRPLTTKGLGFYAQSWLYRLGGLPRAVACPEVLLLWEAWSSFMSSWTFKERKLISL
jgi:hypothetical protein